MIIRQGVDPDVEGSWTVYRLPASHWHCQLTNFHWPSAAMKDTIRRFLQEMTEGKAPHLVIYGDTGTGKSHLSAALYRQAVSLFGSGECWWGDVPSFCTMVKEGFGDNSSSEIIREPLLCTRFLALDDIWARPLTEWETNNVLFRLINHAVQSRAALVVTTNYHLDQLPDLLNPHEVDRIKENLIAAIHLKGGSRR